MDIKSAVAELRKEKKRKFSQTLDLIINLKNYDLRKEALNTVVSLPHAGKKRIAAFLTKKSNLVDTITELDFPKYKETAAMKKLANDYDSFIAVAPMMNKIATNFGRVFGPVGKMPSPQAGVIMQETPEAITAMIAKVSGTVRVKNKELSIKLPVGKEDMSDKQLEENVDAVFKAVQDKLPRKNDNVKDAFIKFTMSKPIKIVERR